MVRPVLSPQVRPSVLTPDRLREIAARLDQDILGIRIHGRGGQGGVVSSKILAKAYFADGICPQTFPKYGVERRGAPAAAFVRVSKRHKLIPLRCEIRSPDHLVVLDETLLHQGSLTDGLAEGGTVLVNSTQPPSAFPALGRYRVYTLDVTSIALRHHLGTELAPIVNSAILGAFCKVHGSPSIGALEAAIRELVPVKKDENARAAHEAYEAIAAGSQKP